MAQRRDEEPRTWFRSERVFRVDGEWFIHTREGIAVGPYLDKFAADVDAEMLKSLLVGVPVDEAYSIIRAFMRRDTDLQPRAPSSADGVDRAEVASLLDEGFDSIRELARQHPASA